MVFDMILEAGHEIVGVSAPFGRDAPGGWRNDALAMSAERRNIPWLESGLLRAETLPPDVDLIVAAHSHDFIGSKTRLRARLGGIGYHPSLLPRHRGRDAIRWALHMGDAITGGSVYWLSDTMDGGDIAAAQHVFIEPGETVDSLWRDKLAPLGVELLARVLSDLDRGVMRRHPQERAAVTWEPSWERAPRPRPDLELLGAAPAGLRVERF
jgi:methionyl-tRNA formyltransferase